MRTQRAPGPVLRLTILAAVVASGLVVASAALELGRAHWGAALVALPLLVAVLVAALVAYPRLAWPAAAAVLAMLLRDRNRWPRRLGRRGLVARRARGGRRAWRSPPRS